MEHSWKLYDENGIKLIAEVFDVMPARLLQNVLRDYLQTETTLISPDGTEYVDENEENGG